MLLGDWPQPISTRPGDIPLNRAMLVDSVYKLLNFNLKEQAAV